MVMVGELVCCSEVWLEMVKDHELVEGLEELLALGLAVRWLVVGLGSPLEAWLAFR